MKPVDVPAAAWGVVLAAIGAVGSACVYVARRGARRYLVVERMSHETYGAVFGVDELPQFDHIADDDGLQERVRAGAERMGDLERKRDEDRRRAREWRRHVEESLYLLVENQRRMADYHDVEIERPRKRWEDEGEREDGG